jgi:glycosyltransferase involved in cell wall biosynthesis
VPKRRVLFICHSHPKVRPGGAEAYAYELHRALRASDAWEPTFVARSGPPFSEKGREHEDVYISPVKGTEDEYFLYGDGYDFDWLFGTMRHRKSLYTRHLRRLLLALQPDVVHFQHTLFIGFDAIREVRRTLPDVPIVYTLHEFLPICRAKGQMVRTMDGSLCDRETPERCNECFPEYSPETFFLRKRFIQSQLALVDLFVAPSRHLLERYVEWGIPPERIVFEDYGRSLPAVPPRNGANRRDRRDRLGFFGQLNSYKGIDVLLEAMGRHARGPAPHGHLWVHGANLDLADHGFRDKVERLLADVREHVTWAGPYSPDQAGDVMAQVDWVVVPSLWWENSPLVIQEAFAHGRPVICTGVGGMAEKVTDGVDGLHFSRADPDDLAAAIGRAVSAPGLWERLRNGIPTVHRMDQHVQFMSGTYERLL